MLDRLFFNRKRHLRALKEMRHSVRIAGKIRKIVNTELVRVFYSTEIFMPSPYNNYWRITHFDDREIIDFLKGCGDEWKKLKDQIILNGYKINHLEQYNSELENNIKSLKLEMKRLNEVIACVSSRVIEIVEQEKQ